jgi:hypothetical protein
MNVTISYHDRDSFTAEEVISTARRNYGRNATVTVSAESSKPNDLLYFALQNLITQEQLSLFFDNKDTYAKELQKFRADIIYLVQETMDNVIIDNEAKLTKD